MTQEPRCGSLFRCPRRMRFLSSWTSRADPILGSASLIRSPSFLRSELEVEAYRAAPRFGRGDWQNPEEILCKTANTCDFGVDKVGPSLHAAFPSQLPGACGSLRLLLAGLPLACNHQ